MLFFPYLVADGFLAFKEAPYGPSPELKITAKAPKKALTASGAI
jgi:hypothetical protein